MLAKSAILNYLDSCSKKDSWEFMKRLTEDELDQEIDRLGVDLSMKNIDDFTKEQKVGILLGVSFPGWTFHLDMGMGKTLIALALIKYRMAKHHVKKTLVVVPNVVNILGWVEEIQDKTDLAAYALDGDYTKKMKTLEAGKEGVYIINYHGLMTVMTKIKKYAKKSKTGTRNGRESKIDAVEKSGKKRVEDREMCERFITHFQMLILDEIQLIKNPDSLLFFLCDLIAMNVEFRNGLTGTPFSEPRDLWSEFYAVDRGETFGDNFALFIAAFYRKETTYFGTAMVFDNRKKRPLSKMMRHRSLQYVEAEVDDKRAKKWDYPLAMSEEQRIAYDRAVEQANQEREFQDVEEVENIYLKLRYICAGYQILKSEDPETQEITESVIHFPENPKLDYLIEYIRGIPLDRKILIYHQYRQTGVMICDRLKEEKISFRALRGDIDNKAKVQNVIDFKQDPSIKALVMSSSGAAGHNLQIANYTVFYESFESPITRSQAEKRNDRKGQTRKVFQTDLVMRQSIDERIRASNIDKRNLRDEILRHKSLKGLIW